jgi:hypothetical protein
MDEIKRPIQARDLGVTGQKIETPKYLYFKGLDGKDYSSQEALQEANRKWMNQFNRYISPWTGKEYTNFQAMERDEREYWKREIKPEEIIINKEKLEFKNILKRSR